MNPWISEFGKPNSMHYNMFRLSDSDEGMDALRKVFPDGEADHMNVCLFSTSGVHGSYTTIEEVEADKDEAGCWVTFLIVHPRVCALMYGNCCPRTPEDFAFLKKLRASPHRELATIGMPGDEE